MLSNKFNEVMKNLEKNIDSEKDLQYVKEQVTDLTMTYLVELGKIELTYNKNIKNIYKKISNLENNFKELKETLKDDEMDVEPITCPYCNMNFLIEYNSNNTEVKCPECKNIIELDWENNSEDDM